MYKYYRILVDYVYVERSETAKIRRRQRKAYFLWQKAVFERDNWKCVKCGSILNIQAHHIKPVREYPDLVLDIDNGKTLCSSCHVKEEVKEKIKYLAPANPICPRCNCKWIRFRKLTNELICMRCGKVF